MKICFRAPATPDNRYDRGDVDLFRTPEERELFFDQFFEDVIFLLVIACNVDRLAKEHGFLELIVFVCEKVVYAIEVNPLWDERRMAAQAPYPAYKPYNRRPGKHSATRHYSSDLTSAAFAAIVLNRRRQIVLRIFRAVAGILIVQSFHAKLIRGEQIFQQLLHRHFS